MGECVHTCECGARIKLRCVRTRFESLAPRADGGRRPLAQGDVCIVVLVMERSVWVESSVSIGEGVGSRVRACDRAPCTCTQARLHTARTCSTMWLPSTLLKRIAVVGVAKTTSTDANVAPSPLRMAMIRATMSDRVSQQLDVRVNSRTQRDADRLREWPKFSCVATVRQSCPAGFVDLLPHRMRCTELGLSHV